MPHIQGKRQLTETVPEEAIHWTYETKNSTILNMLKELKGIMFKKTKGNHEKCLIKQRLSIIDRNDFFPCLK